MMNRIEKDTQPDFRKLAGQYASFFTALGGVCITVLTLILALERVPNRADLHSVLVASLIVATVVSFIGAHLMAETAASIRQPVTSVETSPPTSVNESPAGEKETPLWVGGRLFLLASINIYLGVILTSFSLLLLPATYDKLNAREITLITLTVFLVVVVSAYYWMDRYFVSRIKPMKQLPLRPSRSQKAVVIAASLLASAAIVFLHGGITRKYVQATEFIILIILSASSGFYFNRVYHQKQQPEQRDWKQVSFFFYSAITFSCITIFTLGLRLILPSLWSW
jgi:uncharacterized membrane-anchored protein